MHVNRKMNETKRIEDHINPLIAKLRGVLVIGFSAYLCTWCLARLVDRSELVISNTHLLDSVEAHEVYKLLAFQIIPIVVGIIAGIIYRPKSLYIPSSILGFSVLLFVFTT